jgi:hypothetical protein
VVVLEDGQAVCVDLIGFVDVATHHNLRLGGVRQAGKTAGGFDLVGDPVPVADGFEGGGGARRELGTEIPDGSSFVGDSALGVSISK